MRSNLILNPGFERGLEAWECTPSGVSLVETANKRFVLLKGGRHGAAICSDPIEVVPGARYMLEIERAVRGEADLAMLGVGSLLRPDANSEVQAVETPVRIQVTGAPSKSVGVARVILRPVGPRLRIENLRSTSLFRARDEPFEIMCEVRNTGSELVSGAVARLEAPFHDMLEEHKYDKRLPDIEVAGIATLCWPVIKQRRAYADYIITVEFLGKTVQAAGSTLRHTPRPPEKRTFQNVAGARRWFSVASRGLRVTAHETDLAFGPMLVQDDVTGSSIGVLHHIGHLVTPEGAMPLWSEMKRITANNVELVGSNSKASWMVFVSPDLRERGIKVELRLKPKTRMPSASLEFGPFQTDKPLSESPGPLTIISGKEPISLQWSVEGKEASLLESFPQSRLVTLRTRPRVMPPGAWLRFTASLRRATPGIILSG